jgi:hypothetical protein
MTKFCISLKLCDGTAAGSNEGRLERGKGTLTYNNISAIIY